MRRIYAIVNPAAGGGRCGKRWPAVRAELAARGYDVAEAFTTGPGHATALARAAYAAGERAIVSAGGDGTFRELVQGLVDEEGCTPAGVTVGMLPLGKGCDLARGLGIGTTPEAMLAAWETGRTRPLDAALMEYAVPGGRERRVFLNVAGTGFDGEVTARSLRMPRWTGGTWPYLFGLASALVVYRRHHVTVRMDSQVYDGPAYSVIVANGAYFGGGMHVAPAARPDDGLLDVIILGDMGALKFIRSVPTIYSGTHVNLMEVSVYRAREVSVEADAPLRLEADGDVGGFSPITYRIVPQAVRFLG